MSKGVIVTLLYAHGGGGIKTHNHGKNQLHLDYVCTIAVHLSRILGFRVSDVPL